MPKNPFPRNFIAQKQKGPKNIAEDINFCSNNKENWQKIDNQISSKYLKYLEIRLELWEFLFADLITFKTLTFLNGKLASSRRVVCTFLVKYLNSEIVQKSRKILEIAIELS